MSEEEQPENASEFIRDYGSGDLDMELTSVMQDMARLLRIETLRRGNGAKAKGEISLKIKFSAENQGGRDVFVDTSYDIQRKDPKPARSGDSYFIGGRKSAKFVRDRPRQGALFPTQPQSTEGVQ